MVNRLNQQQIDEALQNLNAEAEQPWRVQSAQLFKDFQFRDFRQAFGFISQLALLAEQQNHHPRWCNEYRKVEVSMTTHEVDGLSERDFKLAQAIETILS